MMLPGEREAIARVVELADLYGYGNLIGHLRTEWARKLIEGAARSEITWDWDYAVKATDVGAYPQHWDWRTMP